MEKWFCWISSRLNKTINERKEHDGPSEADSRSESPNIPHHWALCNCSTPSRVFFFSETSLAISSYTFIGIIKHSNPYTVLDMPLGLQEVKASRISGQSARESGKAFRPAYR